MILNLIFPENDIYGVRVIIEIDEIPFEIKNNRWVQFISLLVSNRLSQAGNGWVTIEDVSHLISFSGIKLESIGKYLNNTIIDFPTRVSRFLKKSIGINTTGPYLLRLDRNHINTNSISLIRYLKWTQYYPISKSSDFQSLHYEFDRSSQRFELATSHQLTRLLIHEAKGNKSLPDHALPSAYLLQSMIEINSKWKTSMSNPN